MPYDERARATLERDFIIVRRLAAGVDGVAYLALPRSKGPYDYKPTSLGRAYVHLLVVKRARKESQEGNILREIPIVRYCDNLKASVLPLFHAAREKGEPFLATRLVHGTTLRAWAGQDMADRDVTPAVTWNFLAQMLKGVLELRGDLRTHHHSAMSIRHGDLHDENVLIDTSGRSLRRLPEPVIIDFSRAVMVPLVGVREPKKLAPHRDGRDFRDVGTLFHAIAHCQHRRRVRADGRLDTAPGSEFVFEPLTSKGLCTCKMRGGGGGGWEFDKSDLIFHNIVTTLCDPREHPLPASTIRRFIDQAEKRLANALKMSPRAGQVSVDWPRRFVPVADMSQAVFKDNAQARFRR